MSDTAGQGGTSDTPTARLGERAVAQADVLCPPSALRERLLKFSQQSYFRNQLLSAQLTFSLMHFYTLSARMRRIFTFFNKPDSLKVIGDL